MSVRGLRLAAALMPAALLLHEGAYAFSGGGDPGSHTYLELALPLIAALAASIAVASLLLPLVTEDARRDNAALAPLGLAGGLLAVFAAQELVEALLLGGGAATFAAALASAWLLLPMALLLGLLAAALVHWLDRTGELLLAAAPRSPRPTRSAAFRPSRPPARLLLPSISPLAFGLARRPPPLPAVSR